MEAGQKTQSSTSGPFIKAHRAFARWGLVERSRPHLGVNVHLFLPFRTSHVVTRLRRVTDQSFACVLGADPEYRFNVRSYLRRVDLAHPCRVQGEPESEGQTDRAYSATRNPRQYLLRRAQTRLSDHGGEPVDLHGAGQHTGRDAWIMIPEAGGLSAMNDDFLRVSAPLRLQSPNLSPQRAPAPSPSDK